MHDVVQKQPFTKDYIMPDSTYLNIKNAKADLYCIA